MNKLNLSNWGLIMKYERKSVMIKFFQTKNDYIVVTYSNMILLYSLDKSGNIRLNNRIDLSLITNFSIEYMHCINENAFLFILSEDEHRKILILDRHTQVIYEKPLLFKPLVLNIVDSPAGLEILFAFQKRNGIHFALYNPELSEIRLISPLLNKPTLGFWNSSQNLIGINEGNRCFIYDYKNNQIKESYFDTEHAKLLAMYDPFIIYSLADGNLEQAAYFDTQNKTTVILDIYASEFRRATISGHKLLFEYINEGKWQYAIHDLNTKENQVISNLLGVITGGVLSADGTSLIGRFESFSVPPSIGSYKIDTNSITVLDKSGLAIENPNLLNPNYSKIHFKNLSIPYFSLNDHIRDKALIYLHGGPHNFSTETFSPLITELVQSNIRVISINFPGSTGFGKEYKALLRNDWGGIDLDAIFFIRHELLKEYQEVYIYGVSYGGYLSLLAAGKDPSAWDKIIACAPFTDLKHLYMNASHTLKKFLNESIGEILKDEMETLTRSPVHYIHQLHSSKILLIHGENDTVCPVEQTEDFYAKLSQLTMDQENINFIKMKNKGHETYSERFWTEQVINFICASYKPKENIRS